jgi:hypothetical protein
MRDDCNKLFGGWSRLYIVFVVMWGGFVALIAGKDWPAPSHFDHEEVIKKLDNENKEIFSKSLVNASRDIDQALAAEKAIEKSLSSNSANNRMLTLKTGATAILPAGISDDDILSLQVAYAEATDGILRNKKIEAMVFYLFFWAVPSWILLGIFWTCGWVFRGFKK